MVFSAHIKGALGVHRVGEDGGQQFPHRKVPAFGRRVQLVGIQNPLNDGEHGGGQFFAVHMIRLGFPLVLFRLAVVYFFITVGKFFGAGPVPRVQTIRPLAYKNPLAAQITGYEGV